MTNLIVIDCHDLGQHLGSYGAKTVASPNLDQIAARGVRFENSFCTSPQCSPSRAALYTGRYPHSNGMMGLAHDPFSWRLHDDEIYLAKYLQDAGYETAHLGIQHVTGFDNEADVRALGFDHLLEGHFAAEVGESAVAFLNQAHDKPFFLNVGFFEPHRDETGGYHVAPPDDSLGADVPPYLPNTPEARQEFTELQGMIHAMDRAVGRIWETLASLDLLKDTWLIFTTDHGLAMPRAKCTMYDPGLETALIMYAEPFGFTGGRVISELISHVDFTPTILEGLGIPVPERLQGRSYWGLLQEGDYEPRQFIIGEKTYHTDYEPQRAIRTERYKLIVNLEVDITNVPADIMHSPIYPQMIDQLTVTRPYVELYDLENDPLEQHNLAGTADVQSIEADLLHQLKAWMVATDDPILQGPIASPYYDRALARLE
ncbi:sulfatase [Phototrophicus methaneseepsis]|uniref:Sulfatase n=1 Tax=Phototrophicus methaneseepsis TaxID=2710758 RepID=A0A7S8EBP7_9CHLR|nr:sulfatase [Phototrophicus methaneseepsis]QPC84037.1 sulfatase [Phototrophicus methaneseepsis]